MAYTAKDIHNEPTYQAALNIFAKPDATYHEKRLAAWVMNNLLASYRKNTTEDTASADLLNKSKDYQHLSEEEKGEMALAYFAVVENSVNFQYMPDELKNNRQFVQNLITATADSYFKSMLPILENIGENLAKDREFIEWVFETIELESLNGKVGDYIYQDKQLFLKTLQKAKIWDIRFDKISKELLDDEDMKAILIKSNECKKSNKRADACATAAFALYFFGAASITPLIMFACAFPLGQIVLPCLIASAGIFASAAFIAIVMSIASEHLKKMAENQKSEIDELVGRVLESATDKLDREADKAPSTPAVSAASSSSSLFGGCSLSSKSRPLITMIEDDSSAPASIPS